MQWNIPGFTEKAQVTVGGENYAGFTKIIVLIKQPDQVHKKAY